MAKNKINKITNGLEKRKINHAALYVRVSTDAQAEEGYSIEAQQKRLIAECESKNIPSYELYIDGGYSGANLDRPRMQDLIEDIKTGKIDAVIVFKLDRLSRSIVDTVQLYYNLLKPNNCYLISLNDGFNTSESLGDLVIPLLSSFAQQERENIRMRTRMGMLERIKEGYWPGGEHRLLAITMTRTAVFSYLTRMPMMFGISFSFILMGILQLSLRKCMTLPTTRRLPLS